MRIHISKELIRNTQKAIAEKQEVVIVTHINPDGDAMGAVLGLYNYLKNSDVKASVIIPNASPVFLHWMPGNDAVVDYEKDPGKAKSIFEKAQLVYCLDFNTPSRAGKVETLLRKSPAQKILIDHHPMPDSFFDCTLSETVVSSSCELVFNFLEEVGADKIDKNVAECILTGIITDTGGFKHSSSRPETYLVTAKLVEKGIDKDRVYANIFDNYSASRMRLMGYALNEKMVIVDGCNTGYISLSKEDLEKFEFIKGDTEGFVNLPLSIGEVVLSALFIEKDDEIKVSLRSKGKFDVNLLARKHFNGGGHKNAAGGSHKGTLEGATHTFETVVLENKEMLQYGF